MTTYKGTLNSHTAGSDSICILTAQLSPNQTTTSAGSTIRQTWERKYNCKVLSISQPYSDKKAYHIEHTGRAVLSRFDGQKMQPETVYHDDIKDLTEIDEL